MAYIAVKAPHIQDGPGFPTAEPAPWYKDAFPSVRAPRPASYNYTSPHYHWMIAQQPPITSEQEQKIDALYRSRWQALLSFDDVVDSVVGELEKLGVADNTYFLSTSDHGYFFGNYRLAQGKWNAYEPDLRIPMVIRGPGIQPGSSFEQLASNVDVMPTILGLAGVATPASMDGQSVAPLVVNSSDPAVPAATRRQLVAEVAANGPASQWKTQQLIEYIGLGNVVRYQHLEDTYNNTFLTLRVNQPPYGNLLYSEFRDCRSDWNSNKPPYFVELYNLDSDPHQLNNIAAQSPASLLQQLSQDAQHWYRCKSTSCRQQQDQQ